MSLRWTLSTHLSQDPLEFAAAFGQNQFRRRLRVQAAADNRYLSDEESLTTRPPFWSNTGTVMEQDGE